MANPIEPNKAYSGPCNETSSGENELTYGQWCPTKFGFYILAGLIVYLFFFSPGNLAR